MTIEERIAKEKADHEAYETKTVAFNTGMRDVTIKEARDVFDKYHKESHWKLRVKTYVPVKDLVVFCRAVEFFQGCRPTLGAPNEKGEHHVMSVGYVG